MIDQYIYPKLANFYDKIAKSSDKLKITANQITVCGFVLGMVAGAFIMFEFYLIGASFFLINRIFDGLDGAFARKSKIKTDGSFFDITFDFLVYAFMILAFSFAQSKNSLSASILLFSYVGATTSFLGWAIIAQKYNIKSSIYPNKGFFYLGGLAEGTETVVITLLMCLFPSYFIHLALIFSALCLITCITRLCFSYKYLKEQKII